MNLFSLVARCSLCVAVTLSAARLEAASPTRCFDTAARDSGADVTDGDVRPDVSAHLTLRYVNATAAQQRAAWELAGAMQCAVLVDVADAVAVRQASRRLTRAMNCVYSRFPRAASPHPARVIKDVEAVTANTAARRRSYLSFSRALDGATWALPEESTCE